MLVRNRDIVRRDDRPGYLYFTRDGRKFRITPWEAGFDLQELVRRRSVRKTPCPLPGLPLPAGEEVAADPVWVSSRRHADVTLLDPEEFVDSYRLHYFLVTLPGPVRRAAESFRYMQYSVLRLLRTSPLALRNLTDFPLLFWLLAVEAGQGRITFAEGAGLLRQRLPRVVRAIFGQDTNVTWKLLRKIGVEKYDVETYANLRAILDSTVTVAVLRHFRALPCRAVELLWYRAELFRVGLVRQTAEAQPYRHLEFKRIVGLVADAVRIGEQLGIENPCRELARLGDETAMGIIHDRWSFRLNRRLGPERLEDMQETRFPAPPIPGDETFRHIDTYRALVAESEEMENCVNHYVNDILSRKCFIYRVMRPERGTLELQGQPGRAVIEQFLLKGNAMPSAESRQLAALWVANANAEVLARKRRAAEAMARKRAARDARVFLHDSGGPERDDFPF